MSRITAKQDPRITRTLQFLQQALVELMSEKSYSSITIQDITTRATLNRATFYLHYRDKGELLQAVLDEMVKNTPLIPNQGENLLPEYTQKAIALHSLEQTPVFIAPCSPVKMSPPSINW